MKNFKAFTLVEVMVCIILTGIVAFFIYTMMLSAHRTYFKLFSVSKQKNDIRYFETLIRKSIWNAQAYEVSGNQLMFKYYVNTGASATRYRVDIYNCGSALESKTLSQINTLLGNKKNKQIKESYSTTTASDICLTSYQGSSYDNALASTPVINNEIVMGNVNKLYYYIESDSSHTHICNLAVVYNRELDDGEVDYEYIIYSFCMKNLFYMDVA